MAKILFEHAQNFDYYEKSLNSPTYDDCLIARISVEKGDESKIGQIAEAITKVFSILKPKTLALFPFAHLSNDLIEANKAEEILNRLILHLENVPKVILPFDVSKGYRIDIKSHKLNNIFRSV